MPKTQPAEWFLARESFLLAAVWIALASPMLLAQNNAAPGAASSPTPTASATAAPAFDVATIKPLPPDGRPTQGWVGTQYHPDGIEFASQALPEILCVAYGYKSIRFDGQVTGLPGWAVNQRYDIVAKMSAADISTFQKLSNDEQERWREAMLQSLLAERFSLKLHHGTKQVPVYEMVVAKGGIKMKDAATDTAPPRLGKGQDGKPLSTIHSLKDTTILQAYSMVALVVQLSAAEAQIGRPVLDKTGLTGRYNFTLDWSIYSASAAAGNSSTEDAPSIFTALGELGLKLQPATDSFDTIVIDHVEKPTEN
ncbi:MAG: TIGR03435 family protein [Acidobacteriaceae bacterium]